MKFAQPVVEEEPSTEIAAKPQDSTPWQDSVFVCPAWWGLVANQISWYRRDRSDVRYRVRLAMFRKVQAKTQQQILIICCPRGGVRPNVCRFLSVRFKRQQQPIIVLILEYRVRVKNLKRGVDTVLHRFRWWLQDRTRLVFQNILYLHLNDQPVPTADTDCECRLEGGCCEAAFSSLGMNIDCCECHS